MTSLWFAEHAPGPKGQTRSVRHHADVVGDRLDLLIDLGDGIAGDITPITAGSHGRDGALILASTLSSKETVALVIKCRPCPVRARSRHHRPARARDRRWRFRALAGAVVVGIGREEFQATGFTADGAGSVDHLEGVLVVKRRTFRSPPTGTVGARIRRGRWSGPGTRPRVMVRV